MKQIFCLVAVAVFASPSWGYGNEGGRQSQLDVKTVGSADDKGTRGEIPSVDSSNDEKKAVHNHAKNIKADPGAIDIVEKLGHLVPRHLSFDDENGEAIQLDAHITKPTIVALVFLSCRGSCPLLLGGLAGALGGLQLVPSKDYEVLTISFDDSDTPSIASQAKVNYIAAIGKPYPEKAWRFLTGDEENIKAFTDAVGFQFRKEKDGFSHPLVLVILSAKGKIVRYLYGTTFAPFDLAMAITEASEEREGLSVNRVLMYCFSYSGEEKKYVFNVLKVFGTATLVFVVAVFVYLTIWTRRAEKKGQ